MRVDPKAILLEDVVGQISAKNCEMQVVTESKGSSGGKVVRLRGKFAEADVPTKNRRVYGRKLWEDNIKRLKESMSAKGVKGELDHPHDGKTRLSRCALYLTDLELKENGEVWGEIEIFPDKPGTPAAQLHSILESGGSVGVSSRGFGLTETDQKGNTIVKEGTYRLDAFDAVEDPAVGDAYPKVYHEDVQNDEGEEMTLEELKSKHPELVSAIAEEASKRALAEGKRSIAQDVAETVERKVASIREDVKRELLADPSVALSKSIVEEIAERIRPLVGATAVDHSVTQELAELRAKAAKQETQLKEAVDKVRQAGVRAYLHTELSYDPCGDSIAAMLGEAVLDMDLREVETKVTALRETMTAQGMKPGRVSLEDVDRLAKNAATEIAKYKTALTEAETKATSLEETVTKLKSALIESERRASSAKSVTATESATISMLRDKLTEADSRIEELELAVEVERLIADRPDRDAIRDRLLECADIEDATDLLERMRAPRRSWRGIGMSRVQEAAKGRGREMLDSSELGGETVNAPVVTKKDQPVSVNPVLAEELGSVGLTVEDVNPVLG